jgi:hypothetical protein
MYILVIRNEEYEILPSYIYYKLREEEHLEYIIGSSVIEELEDIVSILNQEKIIKELGLPSLLDEINIKDSLRDKLKKFV